MSGPINTTNTCVRLYDSILDLAGLIKPTNFHLVDFGGSVEQTIKISNPIPHKLSGGEQIKIVSRHFAVAATPEHNLAGWVLLFSLGGENHVLAFGAFPTPIRMREGQYLELEIIYVYKDGYVGSSYTFSQGYIAMKFVGRERATLKKILTGIERMQRFDSKRPNRRPGARLSPVPFVPQGNQELAAAVNAVKQRVDVLLNMQ